MEQTLGYGVTASSGGMTTPSTTVAGMPGYVAPPPGLTPPDFSSWSLPPPEVPLSRGLPVASQGLPGIGRSTMIRGAVERHARAQQAVQPPGKSTGRGVTFDSTANKAAPTGGESTEDCGRQRTRGCEDGGRSASRPRGVQEKTSRQTPHPESELPSGATQNVPQTTASEGTLPQQGSHVKTLPHDPARLAVKYRSMKWRKDLEYVLKVYYKHNSASYKEGEWVKMKDKFFAHFLLHKEEALDIK